jgi:uncharacterized membrane protein YedE/YeeE
MASTGVAALPSTVSGGRTRRRLILAALYLAGVAAWFTVTWYAGLRQGLLFLTGAALGAVLAGYSFGFTTGWRAWIRDRDPTGILAQFVAIGLAMLVSIPLIAGHPELAGAYAPLSVSLVIGAFIFGAAMQIADGCGSGTLYKAGVGNAFNLATLPGFIAGSFLGAVHLDAWLALGSLPPVSLPEQLGAARAVALQFAALALLGGFVWARRGATNTRWKGKGVYLGAGLLALFGVANLVIAGQPWGVVYGLGLWGAKLATWFGWDLAANAFWGREAQQAQIAAPLLDDVTSVTNLGLLGGALIASVQRGTFCPDVRATPKQWAAGILAGLALGYSARLAFGCNVGAYFSGISTGSLHGWVWLAAAFVGSIIGVRLRARLGLKA